MITRWKSTMAVAVAVSLALVACDGDKPDSSPAPAPISSPLTNNSATKASNAGSPEQTAPYSEPAKENVRQLRLAVDGEGLRLFNPTNGSARPIAFGQPQPDVLKVLQQMRGAATRGTNADCGAGPVDFATWPDGLSIAFQRGRFVGWGIDRRAAGATTTASGVGPGSTREELDAAYGDVSVRQSSLGTEFAAGGFSGVIDGTKASSRITDMWAGTSCVAR